MNMFSATAEISSAQIARQAANDEEAFADLMLNLAEAIQDDKATSFLGLRDIFTKADRAIVRRFAYNLITHIAEDLPGESDD